MFYSFKMRNTRIFTELSNKVDRELDIWASLSGVMTWSK